MAQPATTPQIEALRFRLKTDPKSRLFYPLAEELRKAGQFGEAEQVLRTGLGNHPTYLSAWVSLGRVLRDQKKEEDAIEALNRALQLDPGNVVTARLLADAHLTLGDKVEAIKKYKLVHALLPADQDVQATIARLDLELNPPAPAPEPVPEPEPEPEPEPVAEAAPLAHDETLPPFAEPRAEEAPAFAEDESPWGAMAEEQRVEMETGDAEPMSAAHAESPFEEPVAEYSSAAFGIEEPQGMHIARAPLAADLPLPMTEEFELPPPETAPVVSEPLIDEEEADVFAPAESAPAEEEPEPTDTMTMADLYARQGLVDEARQIYEHILARDPENEVVREKLGALNPGVIPSEVEGSPEAGGASTALGMTQAKIERLQQWLTKMQKREAGRV